MAIKIPLTYLLIFVLCLIFFSYSLLEVPRGITIDEAAFGYNASLISQTLRDENGRFLPIFVLSLEGRDWRQPIAQYADVVFFKILGRSLFNIKFVSVLTAAFSAALIFALGRLLFGIKFGAAALIIFLTSPIILIHSHLALDNITPVPFILIWLLGLVLFQKQKSLKYLAFSGVSLGVSFYAHKSMRSAASVWTALTIFYLVYTQIQNWKLFTLKNYRPVVFFLGAAAPFFLVSPILDYKYAGAVYGNQALSIGSYYDFFYFYLSSFDLSFLFVKGDSILHHSTGKHGMFLLAMLPLFIYGLFRSFATRNKFFIFLAICFFAGPLFISLIGSIHRASRILFLAPIFSLIAGFGLIELLKLRGKIISTLLVIFFIFASLNIYDFLKYYWFQYALDTYHIFYSPIGINAYKKLDEISKKENLPPLISEALLNTTGDGGAIEDFSRSLYFTAPQSYTPGKDVKASVILTQDSKLPSLEKIDTGVNGYFLYVSKP